MIASITNDRSIGLQGYLLHRIEEDMKFFRIETTRKVDDFDQPTKEGKENSLIVGRETYEGMMGAATKYPLLPGRRIIVITRNISYPTKDVVCTSLQAAYDNAIAFGSKRIFVIGGQSLFEEALPFTRRIFLTRIHSDKHGDRFFPPFENDFVEAPTKKRGVSSDGITYEICTYTRKGTAEFMI